MTSLRGQMKRCLADLIDFLLAPEDGPTVPEASPLIAGGMKVHRRTLAEEEFHELGVSAPGGPKQRSTVQARVPGFGPFGIGLQKGGRLGGLAQRTGGVDIQPGAALE